MCQNELQIKLKVHCKMKTAHCKRSLK